MGDGVTLGRCPRPRQREIFPLESQFALRRGWGTGVTARRCLALRQRARGAALESLIRPSAVCLWQTLKPKGFQTLPLRIPKGAHARVRFICVGHTALADVNRARPLCARFTAVAGAEFDASCCDMGLFLARKKTSPKGGLSSALKLRRGSERS